METLLHTLFYFLLITNSQAIKEWWEETKVLELTKDNFESYIGKDKYVFVKFYTKWCIWCRRLSPTYEQLSEEYLVKREDVLIARIEAQMNSIIASRYGIFSFPYLGLFVPGSDRIKDAFLGQRELNTLIRWINERTPVIKKTNLQGANSRKNFNQSSAIQDNGNNTQLTDQDDYFKIEINIMNSQLRMIEQDINDVKIQMTLKSSLNSNSGYVNKNIEDEMRNKGIEITFTPKTCLYMLLVSSALILVYFSSLKYYNKTIIE